MRRRLIIALLFLVVPFQFIWAAAAPYCAHETQPEASKHFGHHQHKHQGGDQSAAASDTSNDGSVAAHADCGSCHLGASASFPAPVGALAQVPRDGVAKYELPFYRSHTPRGLERPDINQHTAAARSGSGVVRGALYVA